MRLWSLHPKYLDPKGLVALWRETLLAQKVLAGKTRGYKNHPQLNRFKKQSKPLEFIGSYLRIIQQEAKRRGYNFDESKIIQTLPMNTKLKIKVTSEQLKFELKHLKSKLKQRSPIDFAKIIAVEKIEVHPLFKKVPGKIEDWEVLRSR